MRIGLNRLGIPRTSTGGAASDKLLDQYPGAAAAYSLRELSAAWAGQPVVRVRRESDDAEADFTAAEIEDGTLINWVFGVTDETLPADYGSGATAAYSLRYVSASYSGPVARVRRDSDNAEMDFNPTEITDGTLVTWVGVGNDGFVTAWYDQRENSNDATQTISADQPKIVSSGTYNQGIVFNGTSSFLQKLDPNGYSFTATPKSVFSTHEHNTADYIFSIYNGYNYGCLALRSGNIFFRVGTGTSDLDQIPFSTYQVNEKYISTILWDGTTALPLELPPDGTVEMYVNSNLEGDSMVDSNYNIATNWGIVIGAEPQIAQFGNSTFSELIIYNSDESTNRTKIEAETNRYYGIYDANAYVTKWYDQSGNANNLIQNVKANQPKLVSAGSLTKLNGHIAIEFDGNNNPNMEMEAEATVTASEWSAFIFYGMSVYEYNSDYHKIFGTAGASPQIGFHLNQGFFFYEATYQQIFGKGHFSARSGLLSFIAETDTIHGYVNGSLKGSRVVSDSTPNMSFARAFSNFGGNSLEGHGIEFIFYPSDKSSIREQIESNINNHYNIY